MNKCTIPKLETLDSWNNYQDYEDELYSIFRVLYLRSDFQFNNKRIRLRYYPPTYNTKTNFYHMITERPNYKGPYDEEKRTPNKDRCERIRWAHHILHRCSKECSEIKIWRERKNDVLIWCPNPPIDFLVILEEKEKYYLLKSAYPIIYKNKRENLMQNYNKYIKSNTAQTS